MGEKLLKVVLSSCEKAPTREPRIYHISSLRCQWLSWWARVSGSGSGRAEFTNNWCGSLIKPRHFSGRQGSCLSTFSPPCASWMNYERPLSLPCCMFNQRQFTKPSQDIPCRMGCPDRKNMLSYTCGGACSILFSLFFFREGAVAAAAPVNCGEPWTDDPETVDGSG